MIHIDIILISLTNHVIVLYYLLYFPWKYVTLIRKNYSKVEVSVIFLNLPHIENIYITKKSFSIENNVPDNEYILKSILMIEILARGALFLLILEWECREINCWFIFINKTLRTGNLRSSSFYDYIYHTNSCECWIASNS